MKLKERLLKTLLWFESFEDVGEFLAVAFVLILMLLVNSIGSCSL
jgi:hypothetical protein